MIEQAKRLKQDAARITGLPASFFQVRTDRKRKTDTYTGMRYTEWGHAFLLVNLRTCVRKDMDYHKVYEILAQHADDFANEHLSITVYYNRDGKLRNVHLSTEWNPARRVWVFANGTMSHRTADLTPATDPVN